MMEIKRGVPQGSVLGPLLFLVYINDLPESLQTINVKTVMYADDATFVSTVDKGDDYQHILYNIIKKAKAWFAPNQLVLNEGKTVSLLFESRSSNSTNQDINNVKFLGVNIDVNLIWDEHITVLSGKLSKSIYAIRKIRNTINDQAALTTYLSLFHPLLTYGILAWGNAAHSHLQKLFVIQKSAVRSIVNAKWDETCKPIFVSLKIMSLFSIIVYQNLLYVKQNLQRYVTHNEIHEHDARNKLNLLTPQNRLHRTNNIGISLYNSLPLHFRNLSMMKFKNKLKNILTQNCLYNIHKFSQLIVENGNIFSQ